MKTVIIVGAGPCGLLMAHYLLQRDSKYCVELYDKRPDPRLNPLSTARSHIISLGFRGRAALREVGLDSLAIERGTMALGQEIHNSRGVVQSISRKKPRLLIERNVLTNLLLETLTKRYDANCLRLKFEQKCLDIDLEAKSAVFQSASGYQPCKAYDLLIGADGLRSKVRNILQHTTGLEVKLGKSQIELKTLTLRCPENHPELTLNRDSVHLYSLGSSGSLLFWPTPNGNYNGIVCFARWYNRLANISSGSEVLTFFRKYMGDFRQLISPEEAEAFAQKPFFETTTVRCSRYHFGNSVLLLGDATHAVSPMIAQGCSAALEDSLVFNQLLDEYDDNLTQAIPQYTQCRRPDMIALEQISHSLFPLNIYLVGLMLLKHVFDRTLHRWFPKFWTSSSVDMISETTIPYRHILHSHSRWFKIIDVLNQLILWKGKHSFNYKLFLINLFTDKFKGKYD
ncbi:MULTISPECIES: NAD(P)/FAD-dependent oxidoreductase [unclassified Moorena]|uniref:FAD-dependent oxidoreductase n=1 Tax=unclassified Moorena TaxID=2683338 RepID=UPI0013CB31D3|nr:MULTISPECIES: NAD(P)/FAD-dependent oxidoreductase [unclassified Moorena]NEO18192.1 FAD-dependent monooxygenase [Moorena sp. SIO4A5]NEQ57337.1 FAD-dependent monooxygenase [Moorena sp. SIO4A1]